MTSVTYEMVQAFKLAYVSGPVKSLSPENERIRRSLQAVIDAHLSRDAVVSEDGVRSAQDAYEAACGEPCDYFGAEAILKSFAARHGGKHEE